ncbi:hypothetical protein HYU45_04750 [Candidatus Daviesbacteria bacterium]|nr:hypothetical protein [Candidatus Daviesbacteria bacterium]
MEVIPVETPQTTDLEWRYWAEGSNLASAVAWQTIMNLNKGYATPGFLSAALNGSDGEKIAQAVMQEYILNQFILPSSGSVDLDNPRVALALKVRDFAAAQFRAGMLELLQN